MPHKIQNRQEDTKTCKTFFLDGNVPCRASYGVYISQLIRFARVMLQTSTHEINV